MTSAKYYSNWLKEAGRGHISAILAWGGFALYLIFKVMSLSVDTDFLFLELEARNFLICVWDLVFYWRFQNSATCFRRRSRTSTIVFR